jgi:hypothetical protein
VRADQLKTGTAYDVAQYGRGVYVAYDRDPEWKTRPFVFAVDRSGREFEVHLRLRDVLATWQQREAEEERERERQQQISANEQALLEFFDKQGVSAARRRRFSDSSEGQREHVRVEAAEDIDQSWLELRWSTLQELLANAREESHDLVAAEAKAKQ